MDDLQGALMVYLKSLCGAGSCVVTLQQLALATSRPIDAVRAELECMCCDHRLISMATFPSGGIQIQMHDSGPDQHNRARRSPSSREATLRRYRGFVRECGEDFLHEVDDLALACAAIVRAERLAGCSAFDLSEIDARSKVAAIPRPIMMEIVASVFECADEIPEGVGAFDCAVRVSQSVWMRVGEFFADYVRSEKHVLPAEAIARLTADEWRVLWHQGNNCEEVAQTAFELGMCEDCVTAAVGSIADKLGMTVRDVLHSRVPMASC